MSGHTPGPWHFLQGATYLSMQGDRAETILFDTSPEVRRAQKCADYERIVACVNSCEGIPTDALSLIGAVASGNAANNAHVEAERDALRAKLDAIRAYCEDRIDGDSPAYDSEWSAVIAYIDGVLGANL